MRIRRPTLLPAALGSLLGCVGHGPAGSGALPTAASTEPACAVLANADPANVDFTDLGPLAPALRRASVVALGEPSHADGTSFAMKSRLVRYLHERLGFHVLAWEASLWSCETDASQCLGWPWEHAAQTKLVRGQLAGLRITGIDPRPTGTDVLPRMKRYLAERVDDAPLRLRLEAAFDRFPKANKFRLLDAATRREDVQVFTEVLVAVRKRPASPDRDLAERAIVNVLDLYAWHEAVGADRSTVFDFDHHAALNDERDRAMAENVRWLLERRHPGEKLILWVANSHAAKDVSCIDTSGTSYDGALRGWNTMGSRLAASLGERYVAIATTAYGGRIGNAPVAPRDLDVAPPGSLEERCVRAGAAYSIAWPAAEPRVGRFFGYEPFRAPWSKVFDLALVIRNMAPVDAE